MKVVHIIPRFIGGGPERHLLALAAAWRQAGHETSHVIAVLEPPISAPLLIKARRLGMAVLTAPADDDLDAAIRDADVVEIVYWNHPRMLHLLRRDIPPARVLLRCTVAGIAPPQVLGADLGRFADAMVISSALSRETAAARDASASGKPIEFIPALADMSRLEQFAPRPHHGVQVGYLGLVDQSKMHPRFAEMVAAVQNSSVHFDVFGDGSGVPELRRRLADLGAGGRVQFHGHVEDLCEAFAEIDIFGYPLAPDTYATSDKTIQESMWAGIPPVLLAGTGPCGLVEHGRTGWVCDTEDEYATAIDLLASDAGLRRRLGDAAREFAMSNFDPARNSARYRNVFSAVAAMPRRSRPPLPGAGDSAARGFVLSLGDMAGPFAVSLGGPVIFGESAAAAADASIARASSVLARGEGGVLHYRNAFPSDGWLRLWSGLIAAHSGDDAAAGEFDAAERLGLDSERVRAAASVVAGFRWGAAR